MLRNRVNYINRYTYETGNPFLKPTISHNVALQASYRWISLYADIERRKDDIVYSSETYSDDDPNIALMRQINASSYNRMNVGLTFSPTIGFWSPQLNLKLYKQWFTTEKPGTDDRLALNRTSYAIRWRNALELPWGITFSADLNWQGRADLANASNKAMWWVRAGLYKDFFDGNLTFLLQANDVFNTFKFDGTTYYG